MTRYFMRDTPLCQLEQQMMTPPNFKARGHGRYSPGFQYSSEDTECPYCINFRRNQPCPLKLCICLDERIAAGALNLNEFVRDCFFPEAGVQLLARLERNFTCCSISFFLNECHRERWQHWRERYYRMSGRNLAALFLLTAYEDSLCTGNHRLGTKCSRTGSRSDLVTGGPNDCTRVILASMGRIKFFLSSKTCSHAARSAVSIPLQCVSHLPLIIQYIVYHQSQ